MYTCSWHAQNYKENCVEFYSSVFPGEAKMGLGFMSFLAPSADRKASITPPPNYNLFQGLFKFMKRHILVIFSK